MAHHLKSEQDQHSNHLEEMAEAKSKALAESEKRFRILFDDAPAGIYETDINGKCLMVNKRWQEMAGMTNEEALGDNWVEGIYEEDRQKVSDNWNRYAKTGDSWSMEYRFCNKKGKITWIYGVAKPIVDDKGIITGYIGTNTDITDRKAAEEEVQKQRDMFETVINSVPARIFWKDKDGVYLGCNPNFIIDAGVNSIEEVTGQKDEAFSWGKDADHYRADDREVMESGKAKLHYEEPFIIKDGNSIIWRTNKMPLTNSAGETIGVIATCEDITERKEAEEKILAQNEQYEALNEELQQTNEELLSTVKREEEINDRFIKAMEATSDGIFDWNLFTNEIYYTPRWKTMLGYKDDELPNDFSVWEKLTDAEDVKRSWNMLNNLIEGKEEKFDIEFKMKHKDGHWVDIHSRADVFKDENGKAIRVVGTHTDISLKKKAEKELLLAKEKAEQANALKTEFLHNMSHEVRTPLNGIMGFCDLLTDLESCSDIHKHYTSIISNSGKQLLSVIDDILEISTLETKQTTIKEEVLDVNQFMMELFSIYDLKSKERKLPLYVFKELANDNSFIRSDKAKLNKILSNLLDNAFKFTNSGKIEFGYSIQKPNIIFYVKDTGIGISADKQSKIFERFSQESSLTAQTYGGLGLGLSIAKENAELLGGTIRVESDKDKGTAFFVEIPYKLPLGTSTNQGNKIADSSNNTINMLVVEDEEVNYLYIEAVLEKFQERKVRLIHVVNGEEAVSRCLSDDTIDVVLMDIKMPVMNGYIATEKIKAVKPHLPVIAQTAYSTSAEKEKALDHGCDDFISKPIDKEELIALVQKFLNGDYS